MLCMFYEKFCTKLIRYHGSKVQGSVQNLASQTLREAVSDCILTYEKLSEGGVVEHLRQLASVQIRVIDTDFIL